jgi:hypothetical protein
MSYAGFGGLDLDFNRIFRVCLGESWVLGPLERFHLHCLFELTAQEVVKRMSGGESKSYTRIKPLCCHRKRIALVVIWSLFIKTSYVQLVVKGDNAVSSLSNSPLSQFQSSY